ncbi:response regulator transcription factor [Paenibacillus sp. strain BS8-2]
MKGKVILVDDELYIRRGLSKLIMEQTTQWTIAGEAKNGQEGLELIQTIKPDLAIIDIRMPVINGIELAEAVARQKLGVELVILTGHKDFAYAQAAVKYGVSDFLLKPCPEEEVSGMLDRMYDKLQTGKRRLERERELLEHEAIRALLLRFPQRDEMTPVLQQSLIGRACWFVEGLAESGSKFKGNMELLQFAIRNIVLELAERADCEVRYVPMSTNLSVLFVQAGHETDVLGQLSGEMINQTKGLLGVELSLMDAGFITELSEVPSWYEGIKNQVVHDIATAQPRPQGETLLWSGGAQSLYEEWLYVMSSGVVDQLRVLVKGEVDGIANLPMSEQRGKYLMVSVVLQTLARKLSRMDTGQQTTAPDHGCESVIAGLASDVSQSNADPSGLDAEARPSAVREMADRFLQLFEQWQERSNGQAVRKAMEYIGEHYREACSLSEVAAHVHFNPTYLSTLFKRETGERFVNYVSKVRMEQARLLLNNTDMKIAEIANLVGFDDPNYFTASFSKMHAMSPNQYRKQHSSLHE